MISDLKERLANIERPDKTSSMEYNCCYSLAVDMYHEITALRKIAEDVPLLFDSDIDTHIDCRCTQCGVAKSLKAWRGGGDD